MLGRMRGILVSENLSRGLPSDWDNCRGCGWSMEPGSSSVRPHCNTATVVLETPRCAWLEGRGARPHTSNLDLQTFAALERNDSCQLSSEFHWTGTLLI